MSVKCSRNEVLLPCWGHALVFCMHPVGYDVSPYLDTVTCKALYSVLFGLTGGVLFSPDSVPGGHFWGISCNYAIVSI